MLHLHLARGVAVERHLARQQLVEQHARRVDVDLAVVIAGRHLGGHVMDGADVLRHAGMLAFADQLAQAVVADLDDAGLEEDIARLEVAMDDAVLVQVVHRGRESLEPLARQLRCQSLGMARQDGAERLAGDVFHHEPVMAERVGAKVVEVDEVRVLEVEALLHAAQLDVEVAADPLERDFLAGVADGEIDLAEAAPADPALDRVAGQGLLPASVGEFHE